MTRSSEAYAVSLSFLSRGGPSCPPAEPLWFAFFLRLLDCSTYSLGSDSCCEEFERRSSSSSWTSCILGAAMKLFLLLWKDSVLEAPPAVDDVGGLLFVALLDWEEVPWFIKGGAGFCEFPCELEVGLELRDPPSFVGLSDPRAPPVPCSDFKSEWSYLFEVLWLPLLLLLDSSCGMSEGTEVFLSSFMKFWKFLPLMLNWCWSLNNWTT